MAPYIPTKALEGYIKHFNENTIALTNFLPMVYYLDFYNDALVITDGLKKYTKGLHVMDDGPSGTVKTIEDAFISIKRQWREGAIPK